MTPSAPASDANGYRAALSRTSPPGLVGENAEDPPLQRRTALEALEVGDDHKPGVLHHLLGYSARRAVHERQAQHRSRVTIQELDEGRLVASSQPLNDHPLDGYGPLSRLVHRG